MSKSALPSKFEGYDEFLSELKEQIRHRQIKAAVAVNTELNLLYWRIGHDILERQQTQGWGQCV